MGCLSTKETVQMVELLFYRYFARKYSKFTETCHGINSVVQIRNEFRVTGTLCYDKNLPQLI